MINKKILLFLMLVFISGCSSPKKTIPISKLDVKNCQFYKNDIDFCSNDNLNIYREKMNNKINFFGDKILVILSTTRSLGKGGSREIKNLVVLDTKNNKVYPLYQSVGNFVDSRLGEIYTQPPVISFSRDSNEICLSGTTYFHSDNNVNVENECYIFKKGEFLKKQPLRVHDRYLISSLPYKSELHFKCIENARKSKCSAFNLNYGSNLVKEYNFINTSDGDAVIFQGSKNSDVFYIISPFEDDGGTTLRIMTIKGLSLLTDRYIPANKNVTIDEKYKLSYFDGGKYKSIMLE